MDIQLKTLEYLDLHDVLRKVEKETNRAGLVNRVWDSLMNEGLFDGKDSFGYVPIEDSHEELVEEYGQILGDDYEAIKQAVSHIPLETIEWLSRG
jgi:hypothetical protein